MEGLHHVGLNGYRYESSGGQTSRENCYLII
jgi:hypothetical protein